MFNNISNCNNTIDSPKNKIKPKIAPKNTFIMSNMVIFDASPFDKHIH